jgi:hypothetical protein
MKGLSTLAGIGVGRSKIAKNKKAVKRTVRYHFAGGLLAKWKDEK